jgi:membrane-bound ClpP family serine protease
VSFGLPFALAAVLTREATGDGGLVLPIALLGLGLVFVVAEALLPSVGILAIGAVLSIGSALVLAFGVSIATGTAFLVAVAVLLPLTIAFGFWLFPRSPFGKWIVNPGLSFEARAATDERDLGLVGRRGVAATMLRPAGHATIDGRRVDVVSRGEMIDEGVPVVVVEVEGNRVVVARDAAEKS